jgi:uncharacterized protein (TIGR02444 family)
MTLDRNTFWAFSCALYKHENVAKHCLYWQDHFGVNVNLVLLAAYATKYQLLLPHPQQLLKAIEHWQQSFQLDIREIRRQCKSIHSTLYEKAKALELAGEKLEQKYLLKAFNKGLAQATNTDPIASVLKHYDVPLDERFEQLLTSINDLD